MIRGQSFAARFQIRSSISKWKLVRKRERRSGGIRASHVSKGSAAGRSEKKTGRWAGGDLWTSGKGAKTLTFGGIDGGRLERVGSALASWNRTNHKKHKLRL